MLIVYSLPMHTPFVHIYPLSHLPSCACISCKYLLKCAHITCTYLCTQIFAYLTYAGLICSHLICVHMTCSYLFTPYLCTYDLTLPVPFADLLTCSHLLCAQMTCSYLICLHLMFIPDLCTHTCLFTPYLCILYLFIPFLPMHAFLFQCRSDSVTNSIHFAGMLVWDGGAGWCIWCSIINSRVHDYCDIFLSVNRETLSIKIKSESSVKNGAHQLEFVPSS